MPATFYACLLDTDLALSGNVLKKGLVFYRSDMDANFDAWIRINHVFKQFHCLRPSFLAG